MSARRLPIWLGVIYLAIYGLVQLAFSFKTHFRPAENDFMGILNIANGIDWGDIASAHNGFFGVGLPAILTVIPDTNVFRVAGLLSLFFGLVTLVATLFVTTRIAGRWWGLAAVVLLSCHPLFFDYFASPGPDLIAIGLTTVGLALYTNEALREQGPRSTMLILAGAFFGVAGLFRVHALILAGGLLLWALLQGNRRVRSFLLAAAGIAVGIAPQVVINLLGGFGPLEADTGFYIYESSLGMDWYKTSSIPRELYASPLQVIFDHPVAFATAYVLAFTNYVLPIATLGVAALVTKETAARNVVIAMFASTLAFALMVSTAASPRGPLPILPQAAIALALVAFWIFDRTRSRAASWQRVLVVLLLITIVIWPQLKAIAFSAAAKYQAATERAEAEARVLELGSITQASQILTNDFFLHFTGIEGNVPDRIGGWENISLNGLRVHEDVRLTSLQDFYCSAQERGITTVLWLPWAVSGVDPELDAALAGGSKDPALVNSGTIGRYSVSLLPPGLKACG